MGTSNLHTTNLQNDTLSLDPLKHSEADRNSMKLDSTLVPITHGQACARVLAMTGDALLQQPLRLALHSYLPYSMFVFSINIYSDDKLGNAPLQKPWFGTLLNLPLTKATDQFRGSDTCEAFYLEPSFTCPHGAGISGNDVRSRHNDQGNVWQPAAHSMWNT